MYRQTGRPIDDRQRSFQGEHDSGRRRGDNRSIDNLRHASLLLLSEHDRVLPLRLDASGVR